MKTSYLIPNLLILAILSSATSLAGSFSGTIRGKVIDVDTRSPLVGANVVVKNTRLGATSDTLGNFMIDNIPVGTYTVEFRLIGFEPRVKTDVVVKSERTTVVQAELPMTLLEGKGVEVAAGFFAESEQQPSSVVNFSFEEIRRAPGSAGDVSRIIMGLPSIAKVNDQSNSLIVRGGSPMENAFYIDNIEIPNINHFPAQGSSGGPIGLLNVDFIQDVSFTSGGFSSLYGDKLSSVMDISLREGNRTSVDVQADLSFAGVGAVAEGPIDKNGSWLLSARRSYVDLLLNAVGANGVDVKYGDYQGKFSYDLNANNSLALLFVSGYDHSDSEKDEVELMYGSNNVWENTVGMNWRTLWGAKGYSNTSVAFTSTQFRDDYYEVGTDIYSVRNRSLEQEVAFRNVNYLRLTDSQKIEFGIEAKRPSASFDNFAAATTDATGATLPSVTTKKSVEATRLGAFSSYTWSPFAPLTLVAGARADYFSFNEKSHISLRLSASLKLDERTSLTGSAGTFYQSLPFAILLQNESTARLDEPKAVHFIFGINHLLTADTKLTLEAYDKEYENFPLDPNSPLLFILDELIYQNGVILNHPVLSSAGRAYARGVEFMLQKKLAENVYGLLTGSYSTARYRDLTGAWRDRVFDNRFMVSAEGGYKLNEQWEFSLRWIYAGGVPYTPFDIVVSKQLNAGVFDEERINGARQPDYHSLNVRFDKRFHFERSNFILYFSVWNVYDRKNVASIYWDKNKNEQKTMYQWGALPVLGLEYDF